MDCLFCKINKNEISSYCLYEDEIIKIILDAYPDCDGHTLIITKKHYNDFKSIPGNVLEHVFKYADIYGDILMKKLDKTSLTLLTNYGDAQVIKHFHLHLMPNYKDKSSMSLDDVYKKVME